LIKELAPGLLVSPNKALFNISNSERKKKYAKICYVGCIHGAFCRFGDGGKLDRKTGGLDLLRTTEGRSHEGSKCMPGNEFHDSIRYQRQWQNV
jgi:hypothetical protein